MEDYFNLDNLDTKRSVQPEIYNCFSALLILFPKIEAPKVVLNRHVWIKNEASIYISKEDKAKVIS